MGQALSKSISDYRPPEATSHLTSSMSMTIDKAGKVDVNKTRVEGADIIIKESGKKTTSPSSPVIYSGDSMPTSFSKLNQLVVTDKFNYTKVSTSLSEEQKLLQDKLIAACSQGNENLVSQYLKSGAKPDLPGSSGKLPLCAAIWGMNPKIVSLIYSCSAPPRMSWEACESYNIDKYDGVFLIDEFSPDTIDAWLNLTDKLKKSSYLQKIYLSQFEDHPTWDKMKNTLKGLRKSLQSRKKEADSWREEYPEYADICLKISQIYEAFRNQIQKIIASNSPILDRSVSEHPQPLPKSLMLLGSHPSEPIPRPAPLLRTQSDPLPTLSRREE